MPLVAFAILTCYSRPYFGMHYPLDVIIGAVLGVGAGYAALAIESYWKQKSESRAK
jgi:undecaprenyl-diphosphatase